MKKLFCLLASLLLSVVMLFCGCSFLGADGIDGRDGKDGQNVTINDIYNQYVSEHGATSFEDFLKEYLGYSGSDIDEAASLRNAINRSLMSGVTILTRFAYTGHRGGSTTYSIFTGSGAILWMNKSAGDAYVVTNCHVIYDDSSNSTYCTDIRLYLYGQDAKGVNYNITVNSNEIVDDEKYCMPAQIVGASVSYDIALLKVTGSEALKRSDAVAVSSKSTVAEALNDAFIQDEWSTVGETVYAIGNASGEGMSASSGIVSMDSEHIDVNLSDIDSRASNSYRVLRTTAPINHGNSGGGLYNTSGKLVGIVNAKDEASDVDNMGYALPANMVRRLLVSMYENEGKTVQGSNGKKYGTSEAILNIKTKVFDSYSKLEDGIVRIYDTVKIIAIEGAPGRNVFKIGDIFVRGKLISSSGEVKENTALSRNYSWSELLIAVSEGDTLTFTIERDNAEQEVSIKFESSHFRYHE